MITRIRKGIRRAGDTGATAVEYGLLVAAIAAVIVGLVFGLGGLVSGAFNKTSTGLSKCEATPNNC